MHEFQSVPSSFRIDPIKKQKKAGIRYFRGIEYKIRAFNPDSELDAKIRHLTIRNRWMLF